MTTEARPLVALISATPAAIGPAADGFARQFNEARLWNILDDRLLAEADLRGGVDEQLARRMQRLIDHAITEGAAAVLLTCSLYGEVAHQYGTDIPVLAPDDAAFAAAAAVARRRVLLVASLQSAGLDSATRLRRFFAERGAHVEVEAVVADGALAAAVAGDGKALAVSLTDGCSGHLAHIDAIVLAQYSLAPAAPALEDSLGLPVIAGPDTAARQLRAGLLEAATA